MALTFEWDARKTASNLPKRGVAFDEALIVFADPVARLEDDDQHLVSEQRLARYAAGVPVVMLDADVAEKFPDVALVNAALCALAKITDRPTRKSTSRRGTA